MTSTKNGMGISLAAFAALAVCAGAAIAGPTKVANVMKDGKPVCPIMKHPFEVKADSPKSAYKNKTYVFCCAGCKPEFEKNPTKYVQTAAKKTGAKLAKPGATAPKSGAKS